MTESYEEKLKEAERKSKEKMEEKLKEVDDLLKSTRAEYDGLVEYSKQTKTFMRENLEEVKMKDTQTSSFSNMPGRSITISDSNSKVQNLDSNSKNNNVNFFILNEIDKRFKERENIAKDLLESRNTKLHRDYKLNAHTRFEYFLDFFKSELRSLNLLHIIDENENTKSNVSKSVLKQQKYDVRERLIGRLEMNYYAKVCEIQEPREILEKFKTLKLSEANLTTMSLREKLYSIKYNPGKEKASAFWNRFEDIVRMYNSLPEVKPLTDDEVRDSFYNAISKALPDVKNLNFLNTHQQNKPLPYESLKNFIIQEESESGRTQASGSAMMTTTKCFNCDEFGHLGRDCPRQGTSIKMCYECRQFVTHRAAQCPKRLAKGKRYEYKNYNNNNRGNRGNRRGRGGNNYRGGIKRSNENQNNSNAKRGRFNNKGGRGNQNRSNRGGKQPNSNDQQDKTALNVNGEYSDLDTDVIKKTNVICEKGRLLAKFLADSGATEHLTNSRIIFKTLDERIDEIKCANNSKEGILKTERVGDIVKQKKINY